MLAKSGKLPESESVTIQFSEQQNADRAFVELVNAALIQGFVYIDGQGGASLTPAPGFFRISLALGPCGATISRVALCGGEQWAWPEFAFVSDPLLQPGRVV
jgi:hypothetical protein